MTGGRPDDRALGDLLARDEIRRLALRYAKAIADRDVEGMVDLFSPDARFGPYGTGPDALRALTRDMVTSSPLAVILVANHLVELEDDEHAHGEVWARCYAVDGEGGYVEQLLRYDDRYVRVDGRWRFLHRRHRLWFGQPAPTPFDQPPADWPRSQVGVGDIPLADPAFVDWWPGAPSREGDAKER